MSKLPGISGRSCVKALEKTGFYLKRWEGSHMILRRDYPFAQVVVPIGELYVPSSGKPALVSVQVLLRLKRQQKYAG